MSVQAIHASQQAEQAQAISTAQAAQKQVSQQKAAPEDKVTISPEAQARHAASTQEADNDHDGK